MIEARLATEQYFGLDWFACSTLFRARSEGPTLSSMGTNDTVCQAAIHEIEVRRLLHNLARGIYQPILLRLIRQCKLGINEKIALPKFYITVFWYSPPLSL